MIFGEIPVADCAGVILAHSLRISKGVLKKGRVLTSEDAAALAQAGFRTVVAARLEPGDVGENDAASELARAIACTAVAVGPAFTGRVNLLSEIPGLAVLDRAAIDRFNLVDETVTLATVEPYAQVQPRQMVATLKIIPFAAPRSAVDKFSGLLATYAYRFQVCGVSMLTAPSPAGSGIGHRPWLGL